MKTKMALMVSAVALGGCVSSVGDGGQGGQGSDTLSSADIADASNATFGVGEPIPIPQDQIPQGNVRYDGIAGFQISDASGPVGVNMTAGVSDEIIGEMTANVNFDDNTGNVEISNLGIYQLPLFEEYETLAGYIIFHHESIPEKSTRLELGNLLITIADVSSNRIEEVLVRVQE